MLSDVSVLSEAPTPAGGRPCPCPWQDKATRQELAGQRDRKHALSKGSWFGVAPRGHRPDPGWRPASPPLPPPTQCDNGGEARQGRGPVTHL